MIIRIIKYLIFSISWHFIFKSLILNKNNYRNILDAFIIHLLSLPLKDTIKFFWELILNNLPENSFLNTVSLPFGLNWKF